MIFYVFIPGFVSINYCYLLDLFFHHADFKDISVTFAENYSIQSYL